MSIPETTTADGLLYYAPGEPATYLYINLRGCRGMGGGFLSRRTTKDSKNQTLGQ
jgi:hypothetical protein